MARSMCKSTPQFGDLVPGQTYTVRPGSYGLVLDQHYALLVVQVGPVFALPGGGRHDGESLTDCLVREIREETGFKVEALQKIAQANQYLFAPQEDAYFNKQCHFFTARTVGVQGTRQDQDHLPRWLPVAQAAIDLTEESHRWAIARLQASLQS